MAFVFFHKFSYFTLPIFHKFPSFYFPSPSPQSQAMRDTMAMRNTLADVPLGVRVNNQQVGGLKRRMWEWGSKTGKCGMCVKQEERGSECQF